MADTFHTVVHMHGIKNEMFNRTMSFALPNGITADQVLGRLVEPDPLVPCGAKLLADGAPITAAVARIDVYEERKVITAQFRFSDLVPILDGDALKAGDVPVGAGNGFVKKGAAGATLGSAFVAEVITLKGKKFASIVKL